MIQVHYFENFKGGPTLLIAGTRQDIDKLFNLFKTWAGKRINVVESLGQETEIRLAGVHGLILDRSLGTNSIVEVVGDICEWRVSDIWRDIILGLLQALVESESAAHQYLDSEESSIQILCSKDEYSDRCLEK